MGGPNLPVIARIMRSESPQAAPCIDSSKKSLVHVELLPCADRVGLQAVASMLSHSREFMDEMAVKGGGGGLEWWLLDLPTFLCWCSKLEPFCDAEKWAHLANLA